MTGSKAIINQYIDHLRQAKMSHSTIKCYASDLRGFLSRSGLPLSQNDSLSLTSIQPKDLEQYLISLSRNGSSANSVRRTSCALRNFFNFLIQQGIVEQNPALTLAVRPPKKDVLNLQQLITLFHYISEHQHSTDELVRIRYRRDEILLLLMILYGVPQYQLCTLRLSSLKKINESFSLLVSTKLSFTLHAFVVMKLRLYLEARGANSDIIFLEPLEEKPIQSSTFRHLFKELRYTLHSKIGPWSLRNTYLHLRLNPEVRDQLVNYLISNSNAPTIAGRNHD